MKQFFDELEEMLISTDIGVATTMQVLDAVRRGVSRQEINDMDALKSAMKNELLSIMKASENKGVASETEVSVDDQTLCFNGRRRERCRQNDDHRQTRAEN